MPRHRPSDPVPCIHSSSTWQVAACVLILAFSAAACEENAPTETRVPAAATGNGSDADAAQMSRDVSALAISLPVNQSVSTASPAPAFRVNQTGTGPDGIFQISASSNTQAALQGLTNGKGRAGFFRIQNTGNTQAALQGQTNSVLSSPTTSPPGSGAAVFGLSTGNGHAGDFEVNSTLNGVSALFATTNNSGRAAEFRITNGSNDHEVLFVSHAGVGPAATLKGGGPVYILQVSSGNATPKAASFNGDVQINGTLTKTAGSFRIDHPLDPQHKFLSHSFVESPDMKNVYDGNAVLDAEGRATVELPDYFEALNKDFRYQLTAIGSPGPNLYIAQGVTQNHFAIAGGRPYAHVSWQITGIRKDAYAEEHRIKVEEDKPVAEQPAAGQLVAQR